MNEFFDRVMNIKNLDKRKSSRIIYLDNILNRLVFLWDTVKH